MIIEDIDDELLFSVEKIPRRGTRADQLGKAEDEGELKGWTV